MHQKSMGREETALSPIENVLASLAACSSFHVLIILKKKRQKVSGYSVACYLVPKMVKNGYKSDFAY